MPLYSKITDDLKTAMKAREQERVEALRFALAGLNNFQKEKQVKEPGATITDEEVVSVLQKDIKRRKESIELFKQGKRDDLVAKESADLAVISAYVPAELSIDDLGKLVDQILASGTKDYNSVMKETMKLVKGRADGRMVGEVIKSKLA